jgi:hypothetical protein
MVVAVVVSLLQQDVFGHLDVSASILASTSVTEEMHFRKAITYIPAFEGHEGLAVISINRASPSVAAWREKGSSGLFISNQR